MSQTERADADISDLRWAIIPRSDQINAEQLLIGPRTIKVTSVQIGSDEQPVIVHYEGEDGRPYKPSKTQRKVILFAWGPDGHTWIGKSMTIYCDPKIKFGGEEVGGIRISHISDIEQDLKLALTASKGKKAVHVVKRLVPTATVDHAAIMRSARAVDELRDAFRGAYRSSTDAKVKEELKAEYDNRMAELTRAGSVDPQSGEIT